MGVCVGVCGCVCVGVGVLFLGSHYRFPTSYVKGSAESGSSKGFSYQDTPDVLAE